MTSQYWRHGLFLKNYVIFKKSFFNDVIGGSNFANEYVFWDWIENCPSQNGYVAKISYGVI